MKRWQRRERINEIHAFATTAMAEDRRDIPYKDMHAELNALKRGGPSTTWLEAQVMLSVVARKRPARARGLLRRLQMRHDQNGAPDQFEAFEGRISTYLHPDKLTNHGYHATFADLDHDAVWSHLGAILAELEKLGLEVFLNSGTLLGVVRDGKLLDHDDDIDLAVMLKADGPEAAAEEWQALGKTLRAAGLFDDDSHRAREIHKLIAKDHVEIDLFPMWTEADRVFVYPHTCGDLVIDDVLPLRRCDLSGHNIPARPEKMLAQNYGEGWQVPDPLFRFNWPGQNKKFSAFRMALRGKGGPKS